MKKIISFLILALISVFVFAEEITILSFNIAHNSSYKKENKEEWLNQLAQIICENSADIVLLQEVPLELKKGLVKKFYGDVELHFRTPQDRTFLNQLAEKLGSNWNFFSTAAYLLHDGVVIDGTSFSGGDMGQNNAVLYDSQKFSAEDLADKLGFTNFPDCDYRFNKNNLQVVRFFEKESGHFFVVSNVHLQSKNNIEKRNSDLENLADMLLNEFGGELSDEPIIVAGDFNTSRREFENAGFYFYIIDGKSSPKTTLSTNSNRFKYANDYDHFVYNSAMQSILVAETRRAKLGGITNLEKADSIELYAKEFRSSKDLRDRLSDHVPILLVFDFALSKNFEN